MQEHPRLGATMLAQTPAITPETCRLVAEHHERLDGSGYPQGLRGAALSSLSQTVAIADIYETMLGNRAGRPPLLPAQALKELYQCGRLQQLDLHLVEMMVRCLGIYPVGSLVVLNTGERAVVIAANPANVLRPVVRLLGEQQPWGGVPPVLIDLAAPDTGPSRSILQALDPATAGHDVAMRWQEGHRS
jgi:HD-GYP domain-containing protein (c-di-GMP phosphodiesterase class II)